MALRQILEYPNPLLKKRAAPVAAIGGEVVTLIEDLAETMYAAPGVGLAATQVGSASASSCSTSTARTRRPGSGS